MTGVSVLLPWPPSTNSLWRAFKGRNVMSARYRAWITEATRAIGEQQTPYISGPVKVALEFSPPTKRSFDLDNYCKAVLDMLCHANVIEADDKDIVTEITLKLGAGFTGVWAHVDQVADVRAL